MRRRAAARALATPVLGLLAACASTAARGEPPAGAQPSAPTAETLVSRLLSEEGAARTDAEGRLVAAGEGARPAVRSALEGATGEARLRLLGVLAGIGPLPDEVSGSERAELLLWRLRGGNGGPAERVRALADLRRVEPAVRDVLARRAGEAGPDRALALYALARTEAPEAVATLAGALDEADPDVRTAAAEGLRRLTGVDWRAASVAERERLLRDSGGSGRPRVEPRPEGGGSGAGGQG